MFDADPAPGDPPADPAVARAERRLAVLQELTEIGMRLARSLDPGAAAPGEPAVEGKGKSPADAFAPLSRAIRLTVALGARTDQELRDLKAGVIRERAEERVRAKGRVSLTAEEREARTERVRELVLCLAEHEVPDSHAFDRVYEALDEELEEDEDSFEYAERPPRESVERLCQGLGLHPDWNRWSDEGWILDDVPPRPEMCVFRRCGSRPEALPTHPWPRTSPLFQRLPNGHDLE